MACTKYHNIISAYVDDEASTLEVEALMSHLENCPACRLELKNATLLNTSVSESYESSVDVDFSVHIMSSILESKSETSSYTSSIISRVYRPVAVAASVAIVASIMVFSSASNEVMAENKDIMQMESLVMEHMDRAAAAEQFIPEVTFASYNR